ncbi:MAG: HutD family protein, partial [Planctomycetota bacterium]|nr:HutD family protein [Planctomycetota bacterium]
DGLVLVHGDDTRRVRLRRMEPYGFSGDRPTSAELTHGPVADFNVMTRRDIVEASVETLALGSRRTLETLAPGHGFVHVLRGRLVARAVGEEEAFELEAGDSLWLSELRSEEDVDLAGTCSDCALLVVRISASRER